MSGCKIKRVNVVKAGSSLVLKIEKSSWLVLINFVSSIIAC